MPHFARVLLTIVSVALGLAGAAFLAYVAWLTAAGDDQDPHG